MIRIVYGSRFLKSARLLPKAQQHKLAFLLTILKGDPFDKRLHVKRLAGELAGLHSFRITRDWRVMYQFLDAETVQLLYAVHRKDVYR